MLPAAAARAARSDWWQAALVAAALFAVYAATSSRTVELEDDGLFVLSSYFLGVEHPPGYPLFTFAGHLFSQLPFGSVAYRVHLASAFFGALTCAVAWLCARILVPGRLAAYLVSLGLGLSPVFWSQSIIAEVYTLNTLFLVVLIYLGLKACPPAGAPQDAPSRPPAAVLPLMAFVFGLSLSNHYPLMLLVAPAFAILLWPARKELLDRLGLLSWLVILGLLPYVWMVRRSWMDPAISFDGPLETIQEIWYFVSRAGYAHVDQAASAGWLDQVKYFLFLGGQILLQFALAGTLLAAVGAAVQRRAWGGRVALFFLVAFLMPSVVLLLLLGFDYDSVGKHVFHVYPLPAYVVLALWMGLGFGWFVQRHGLGARRAAAACAALVLLVGAVGARSNVFTEQGWGARYAEAILRVLPRDTALFTTGESDMGTLAYFYLVEHARPDIELYQSRGLVLGNRLFHPLRTSEQEKARKLGEFVERHPATVAYTVEFLTGYAKRDRWLFVEVDKSSADASKTSIDIPEELLPFFEQSVLPPARSNAWIAYQRDELRRRFAVLLAQRLRQGQPVEARDRKYLGELSRDFYGLLGLAEGLMKNEGYAAGAVNDALTRARDLMPDDLNKATRSRFFYLRGVLRLDVGDRSGALRDLDTSFSIWPVADNPVLAPLRDLYRASNDAAALKALEARIRTVRKN